MTKDGEKTEVFNAFFASILSCKTSYSQNTLELEIGMRSTMKPP